MSLLSFAVNNMAADHLGPLSLTRITFNPFVDKLSHRMKLLIHSQTSTVQHMKFGIEKQFHPTLYNGCNYLSTLGSKLNHVSRRDHWCRNATTGHMAWHESQWTKALPRPRKKLLTGNVPFLCRWPVVAVSSNFQCIKFKCRCPNYIFRVHHIYIRVPMIYILHFI